MRLGVAGALLDGELVPGDVDVADGIVAGVGLAPPGASGTAVPGFVDLQVNGCAGVDLASATSEDYAIAGTALARAGVSAYRPTFVTAAVAELERALAHLAGASGPARRGPGPGPGPGPGGPRLLGAHLEGPFLSPRWPGAHPVEHLRAPDGRLVDRLRQLGPIGAVTLAPELPGGLALVGALAERGIVVQIGHTDADAATAHQAFDAGARALTHVYNAHRRWQPRDPGPAGAALSRRDVSVTAIVDGVHLAAETVAVTARAAGARLCLVSDAMAAAGLGAERRGRAAPADSGRLGGRAVVVRDGASRLPDGRLAGSVGMLDEAVRRLVALGASLPTAVHAAARAPALLARRPELGRLAPGGPADICVLDAELEVVRTLVAGVEVHAR